MDNQFYQQNNFSPQSRRSQTMEIASIVLGIIAVATCCCFYISLFCGALSIMFALLSRGGEMKLSQRALIGLILGIIGLALTVIFYAFAFFVLLLQCGSWENLYNMLLTMSTFDSYDEMLQYYYSTLGTM